MEGLEFVAQVNDTRPRALAVAVNEALKEEEEVPSARSAVAEKQLLVMMCQVRELVRVPIPGPLPWLKQASISTRARASARARARAMPE